MENMMEDWKHQIDVIAEAVDIGQLKLNDWEEEFVDSITNSLFHDKELSFKQSTHLRRIFNKVE